MNGFRLSDKSQFTSGNARLCCLCASRGLKKIYGFRLPNKSQFISDHIRLCRLHASPGVLKLSLYWNLEHQLKEKMLAEKEYAY